MLGSVVWCTKFRVVLYIDPFGPPIPGSSRIRGATSGTTFVLPQWATISSLNFSLSSVAPQSPDGQPTRLDTDSIVVFGVDQR
jgi:hypothetical protein